MIIFGFRSRPVVMARLNLACRNGHVAAHRLLKVTRWFTLFFVPVIPFSRKYYTVCAQCGTDVVWSKADAETAAAHAGLPSTSPPGDPVARPLPTAWPAEASVAGSAPPAGWYRDPSGTGSQRYWDGTAWTDAVSPA